MNIFSRALAFIMLATVIAGSTFFACNDADAGKGLDQLTLVIGVNSENIDTVIDLEDRIRNRDILLLEEGHVVNSVLDLQELSDQAERLRVEFPKNRIFMVARPSHLPFAIPEHVSAVIIDHERSSWPKTWSPLWEWQILAMDLLQLTQPEIGLISPPPTVSRLNAGWDWGELSDGMLWHNVMVQAACRDGGRTDGDVSRWNNRADILAQHHNGDTRFVSMQITMKQDAQQYTDPNRVILCARAARYNGVANVLLFGGNETDLTIVLTTLRVAY